MSAYLPAPVIVPFHRTSYICSLCGNQVTKARKYKDLNGNVGCWYCINSRSASLTNRTPYKNLPILKLFDAIEGRYRRTIT